MGVMPLVKLNNKGVAIWRWFCRCPDVLGPIEDDYDFDEFFTPPTSSQLMWESAMVGGNVVIICPPLVVSLPRLK